MRRYDDPVEVRLASESPHQFVWRGRLYVVGAVLAHWVEVGAWWRIRDTEGLPVAAHATGRQVWRVEARAGRSSTDGVYDLSHDLAHDDAFDRAGHARSRKTWSLARALD